MKKQRKQPESQATVALRLWTYAGVTKAIPYIRSLVQSMRDGWLELRQAQEHVRRIAARPGRPDRDSLIRLEESQRDVARQEAKLEETIDEMLVLSAFCVDPRAGLTVIPFMKGDELAWFVFDLFDPKGVNAWRLHTDPIETRRALTELDEAQLATIELPEGPALA